MKNTVEALKVRIHQLQQRDPVANVNIINNNDKTSKSRRP